MRTSEWEAEGGHTQKLMMRAVEANDGVHLIPAAMVDEVLLRVEETFEKENAEREHIAAGMSVDEVYRVLRRSFKVIDQAEPFG